MGSWVMGRLFRLAGIDVSMCGVVGSISRTALE